MLEMLQFVSWQLDALRTWTVEDIQRVFTNTALAMEIKQRNFNKPFFVLMSGSMVSTPLYQSMLVLGSDLARVRVRSAIKVLNEDKALGKKKVKKLEKAWRQVQRAIEALPQG